MVPNGRYDTRAHTHTQVLENNTVQVECNEHYEIAGSGTTDQPGTRLGETVCMPDGSYDPILQCDGPWCDGLVPPPHAIAFPATRVRVGEVVRVICKMGYAHWGDGTKEPRCLQPPRLFESPQACYRSCGVHPDVHGASVWPKVPRLYIGDDSSKFEVAGGGTWPQVLMCTSNTRVCLCMRERVCMHVCMHASVHVCMDVRAYMNAGC